MEVARSEFAGLPVALATELAGNQAFALGELSVRREEGGEALISGPGVGNREVPSTPDAIRAAVRHDDCGRYRPLSGARTMPGGWFTRLPIAEVASVLEVLYPLAIEHMAAAERGDLRTVPLEEVLARQTGRYRVAESLDSRGRETASKVLCGSCVRVPAWRGDTLAPLAIPCPEPCSVLVSLCREAALWQESVPASAPLDLSVPYAAFEVPGNGVREAYLAAR